MGKTSLKIIYLFIGIAFAILIATHWTAQLIVSKMEKSEEQRVKNWASSLQQQSYLIDYTKNFFTQLEEEERKSAAIWQYAYQRMMSPINVSDFNFFIDIFSKNRTIPFIITDRNYSITDSHDPEVKVTVNGVLKDSILDMYKENPPLPFKRTGKEYLFFYRRSTLFTELQKAMNILSNSFNANILENVASIPVIVTDHTKKHIINFGNIDGEKLKNNPEYLQKTLKQMQDEHEPVLLSDFGFEENKQPYYVFYQSSSLLDNLRLFPYILSLSVLFVLFGIILVFKYSQKSEQDRVWVGLSKETAHQLGTPLSSLLAWIEYFKAKEGEPIKIEDISEVERDVARLEIITQRFSKIGAVPELKEEDIVLILEKVVDYMKKRCSQKISFSINADTRGIYARVNAQLLDWVIENLCKNAVNAICDRVGSIELSVNQRGESVNIDVKDTGNGISKKLFKTVFKAGYTTRNRSWGLGLTLSKRIVEKYHHGKLFVKESIVGKGTTFRIILPLK